MARVPQVATLIEEGWSPKEIQLDFRVTFATVTQYIYRAINEGLLTREDVVSSVPPEAREIVEKARKVAGSNNKSIIYQIIALSEIQVDADTIDLLLAMTHPSIPMEDMYTFVSNIELTFHLGIKSIMIAVYGPENWWVDGIPKQIRKECSAQWQDDDQLAPEAYCYTNLIHMRDILDKKWKICEDFLPQEFTGNKQETLSKFLRLNHIRNSVMHPVKRIPLTFADLEFVKTFSQSIQFKKWRNFPHLG